MMIGLNLFITCILVFALLTVTESVASALPSSCKSINGLPDPKCTPGATNPQVTQSTIGQSVCVPGFTKTIRPSTSFTNPLKTQLMKSYGLYGVAKSYELDHLISLELGGAPSSVANLWPESWTGVNNAHTKDKFENYLHRQVCKDKMTLSEAQHEISTNWVYYWTKAGKP